MPPQAASDPGTHAPAQPFKVSLQLPPGAGGAALSAPTAAAARGEAPAATAPAPPDPALAAEAPGGAGADGAVDSPQLAASADAVADTPTAGARDISESRRGQKWPAVPSDLKAVPWVLAVCAPDELDASEILYV